MDQAAWTVNDLRSAGLHLPDGTIVNGVAVTDGAQILNDFNPATANVVFATADDLAQWWKQRAEEFQANIARRDQVLLHGMHFGPETGGKIDMRLGGETSLMFMAVLAELFRANGGVNYLTVTGHSLPTDDRPAMHLEITIRNCDGTLTPAEDIARLKDRIKELEAAGNPFVEIDKFEEAKMYHGKLSQ